MEIIEGIKILQHMIKPAITIIGIEDNKPEAAQALNDAINTVSDATDIIVQTVPTKYPNGGEKQLIKLLTGKEIVKGQLPTQSGIVMQNVGTVYAIQQAVIDRQPLISRIVTLTGKAFPQPRNVRALIGTQIGDLMQQYHNNGHAAAIIYGGPMMGFTLPHGQFSLTKTGNCILLPEQGEIPQLREADACIRCGECAEVCPVDLLPQQLHWYSKSGDVKKLTEYNLMDCIECGACSFVCPSQIPLVHQYRIAKVEVREHAAEQAAAAVAKDRFEKRNARLAIEKQQRELKQQEAAKKRRETATATTGIDPVQAALERINKAKQAEQQAGKEPTAAISDAIARAKAKKVAMQQGEPDNTDVIAQRKARKAAALARKQQADADDDAKPAASTQKPAVAAAIARAKAKQAAIARAKAKQAAAVVAVPEAKTDTESTAIAQPMDAKKAAIAAAIARAKAKQAAAQQSTSDTSTAESGASPQPVDAKKAAVAAAIARAKAKQAAAQQGASDKSTAESGASPQPVDAKKAAIAAAIARAKAKKAAQASTSATAKVNITAQPEIVTVQHAVAKNETSVDDKKAAIAAAIAKAKAKKLAQFGDK